LKPRNQSFFISALLMFALIAMIFYGVQENSFGNTEIPINQLAADIEAGKVSSIEVDGNQVEVQYKNLEQKNNNYYFQRSPKRLGGTVDPTWCFPR